MVLGLELVFLQPLFPLMRFVVAFQIQFFPLRATVTNVDMTVVLVLLQLTSELLQGLADVRQRVHAVARYYLEFSREHEAYFRQFLAKSFKAALEDGTVNVRGGRRLTAFAEALEPVRSSMSQEEYEDLSRRLSMTSGMEQFIILEDILRVDQPTADRLQMGLVDALLDRYLPADHQ